MTQDFQIHQTKNKNLLKIVDSFFYLKIPTTSLQQLKERIIPYPRVTLGYFFDCPFSVSDGKIEVSVDFIFSRISTKTVQVKPQTAEVKIIGVHFKPYALAFFTHQRVKDLPIILPAQQLLTNNLVEFKEKIVQTHELDQQFKILERLLLHNLCTPNIKLISTAINKIEASAGQLVIDELANELNMTNRTLRNHFYQCIGCSPKEYAQLVKLNRAVIAIKAANKNLTAIAHEQGYFDQAHFVNSIKSITGKSPKSLQKEVSNFRFLQF